MIDFSYSIVPVFWMALSEWSSDWNCLSWRGTAACQPVKKTLPESCLKIGSGGHCHQSSRRAALPLVSHDRAVCWVLRRWRQQQASHFYQRLSSENKRLSSKNSTSMLVYNVISYGDNKSWWILIMTPLALPACTHHHLTLPRSFVNAPRPARPAGCQMELTRSQPALSLLSPAALEGKPSSEAKATSPPQILLLCHSAGTRRTVLSVLRCCSTFFGHIYEYLSFSWMTEDYLQKMYICCWLFLSRNELNVFGISAVGLTSQAIGFTMHFSPL